MPLALFKRKDPALDQPLDRALGHPLDPALGLSALPMTVLLRDLPVPSPSTTWESSTSVAPPSMETPHHGVPPRLMPTTTTSLELVPGDTVMPLALFKRKDPALDQPLDRALGHPLDPALGLSALPMTALLRDLLAPSPSTTWESSTSVAPPSMETPHPGVQPRLMPTTTMSPELVPGDTAMPLALFKRPLPPQHLPLLPQLLPDLLSLLPQELASAV